MVSYASYVHSVDTWRCYRFLEHNFAATDLVLGVLDAALEIFHAVLLLS